MLYTASVIHSGHSQPHPTHIASTQHCACTPHEIVTCACAACAPAVLELQTQPCLLVRNNNGNGACASPSEQLTCIQFCANVARATPNMAGAATIIALQREGPAVRAATHSTATGIHKR
jgi:hypothetical protein